MGINRRRRAAFKLRVCFLSALKPVGPQGLSNLGLDPQRFFSPSLSTIIIPHRFTDLPKKARGSGTGLEELTVLRSMAVGKRLAADAAGSGDGGVSSSEASAAAAEGPLDEAELLFRASRDAGERVSWLNKYLSALEAFEAFLRSEGILEPRAPTPRVPLPGGGMLPSSPTQS